MGRRPADPSRARGRHLLPRRGRRGPAGHHRRDPPARRPPPAAPDRPPRRRPRRRPRASASSCPTTPATRACSRTSRTRPASAWSPSSSTSRRPTWRRRSSATRPASTHDDAARLVQLAQAIRRLDTAGLREVASTRVLIAAGAALGRGHPARRRGPGRDRRAPHRRPGRRRRAAGDDHHLPAADERGLSHDHSAHAARRPPTSRARPARGPTGPHVALAILAVVAALVVVAVNAAHGRGAPSGSRTRT